jgi:succinate dehydrogenase flavin-adding protein (antitoxin of CptAB toxin-antitoxin module)
MNELKQVFTTPDGSVFDTRAEALEYLRKPKVMAALKLLTKNNEDLSEWLYDNRETVESAFDAGTVRRVTKAERNKLIRALDALEKAGLEGPATYLLETVTIDGTEHTIKDIIVSSFKWPTVQRLKDEEKTARAKEILVEASDNEELADWAIENQEAILEAYKAGIEKRQVSPKAQEALAAYRAEMAKKKAAAEAAESGESEPAEEK